MDDLGAETSTTVSQGEAGPAGVERWFKIHRGVQSLGTVLCIAGVACAFSTMGTDLDHWHNRLGCALPVLLGKHTPRCRNHVFI